MKPFLLLGTRDYDDAALGEYRSVLRHSGLTAERLHYVRVEAEPLPEIDLNDYAGVLLGGSSYNVSDEEKSAVQLRVEADLNRLVAQIVDRDFPFFGMCYGIGAITTHLGGVVDRTYGEPVGAVPITLTDEGRADPITAGVQGEFQAFVGHKEACVLLPKDAVLLATGEACPVQMYRVGQNVYATQFHPELDADDLATRMRIYEHAGYFAPEEMESLITMAYAAKVSQAPHRILANFVQRHSAQ